MRSRLAALGLVTMLLCVGSLRTQDKDESIKVDTRLVSIPVIVSDRNGRYVPNLGQADFTVFQDGNEQPIAFFAATEEPVTVAILIDTSNSTRDVLGDIKDSAKAFIKLLTPRDRAMIVSFDYDTHILSALTSDQEQLKQAIKHAEIPKTFGTTLRDAVFQTVTRSFAGINGRKAIIVLTDGKDAGSYVRSAELLNRLEESDTLVYTVMFQTGERQRRAFGGGGFPRGGRFPGGGGRFPRGGGGGNFPRFPRDGGERQERREERVKEQNADAQLFLENVANTTAGRFFSSKNGKLKKTFADILDELRFQYRLGFYPPEDENAAIHRLKVKVDRPDAVVRARPGYRSIK
jgi:hypothetical protein